MYGSLGELLLQLVLGLAVIVGMIWLLAKLLAARTHWVNRHRPLKVLGGVGLGPHKSLQIVEIGGVLYVIGVGDDVTLLRVIDDPAERERIEQSFAQVHGQAAFAWFDRLRPKALSKNSNHFALLLKEQLNEVRSKRENVLKDWLNKEK